MTPVVDDDILLSFQEECREHLDGIEVDLLDIEEKGADADPELVNKIFRSMHSIKGGAGFMGMEKAKDLAHVAENILNLFRNHELTPSSEIVTNLLDAADALKSLINSPASAEEMDISRMLDALQSAATVEPAPKNTLCGDNDVSDAGPHISAASEEQDSGFVPAPSSVALPNSFDESTIEHELQQGKNIYAFQVQMKSNPTWEGKTLSAFLGELKETGRILASTIDIGKDSVQAMPCESFQEPVSLLFSTIMEKDLLAAVTGVSAKKIFETTEKTSENQEDWRALFTKKEKRPLQTAADPVQATGPAKVKAETDANKKTDRPPVNAQGATESSLRVNVKTLDNLMALAGELVLTRNQLTQTVDSENFSMLDNVSLRLDLITSELQEAIMSTRMQPVGNVFNKFKRVVRDLSRNLEKEIDLVIAGAEVELDKTIVEAIGDPITHLVRNAVDHGIEMPAERSKAGKAAAGKLRLSAFHEGGHVIIEIVDDGAGINIEKIKEKALKIGTFDSAQLEAMPEKELAKLIFTPGLSTAKKVTDVSGRGVGMDVVHANLTKVGGIIDIESRPGKGTTLSIKLPLTLAIIPSLMISVENERYALPQVNIIELVRIPAGKVKEKIEQIGSALVIRLRGELLPLIRLVDVLGIEGRTYSDPESKERLPCRRQRIEDRRGRTRDWESEPVIDDEVSREEEYEDRRSIDDRRINPGSGYNILVVSAGNFHYGLIVDTFLDSEEIVVKPIGSHLRNCRAYAGATIQGDGRVALILDVVGISALMGLTSVAKKIKNQGLGEEIHDDKHTLLLVRNCPEEQLAIPIALVTRIERINKNDVAFTGGRRNIKYRDGILPLFGVEEAAEVKPLDSESPVAYVIVFMVADKEVGIIVGELIDIVDVKVQVDDITHRQPGIIGSAIIGGEITLITDLYSVVSAIMPEWTREVFREQGENRDCEKKILIVEDTEFFSNRLCEFIVEAGYSPLKAFNGKEALEVLEKYPVDLVVTDIEMPQMDGIELTKLIRARERWRNLPVIAVTSLAGEAAERRGLAAGVDDYLIKIDREQIVKTIKKHLEK